MSDTARQIEIVGGIAVVRQEPRKFFELAYPGRRNAFMAGQLSCCSVEEVVAYMPEIEAFAEIGDHNDLSVHLYSSDIQVRVAFSEGTFRLDEFIIDEALSVGDAFFQHKSFDRASANSAGRVRRSSSSAAKRLPFRSSLAVSHYHLRTYGRSVSW